MTPTFFDSTEKLARLDSAALSLEGTPFFPNSEAPGADGGIDCVHTLNWLYRACGVIEWIDIPTQDMDHGQHSEHSLLIEAFETWLELNSRFTRLPDCSPSALLPGDALCFTAGLVPHHGAVMLEAGEIIHALARVGVHRMRLDAVVRGRRLLGLLSAAYRPRKMP